MKIHINSIEFEVCTSCSLTQAIALWLENSVINQNKENNQLSETVYVVALNQTFISKALYGTTSLNADDQIEILSPMSGG